MQALGLLIEGIPPLNPYDSGDVPVLYTEGLVDDVSAVADLAAFSSLIKRPWIPARKDAFGGFNWGATPRDPFGKPSPVTIQITDAEDILGPLFMEDFGDATTVFYRLHDTRVTRAQTSFRVDGAAGLEAPQADRYLWLRNEAVFVTGVSTVADGVWDIDVTRAQCGSRALPHQLRPRAYPSGSGLDQALYFSSRPDFDRQYFPARLYTFDMEGSTVIAARIKSFGFVSQRPRPTGPGWVLTVMPDEQRMLEHQHSGKKDISLSRCVRVTDASHGYEIGLAASQSAAQLSHGKHPRTAAIWCTRLEAEQLLEETLHLLEENYLDLGTLSTRMSPGIVGTIPWQYALALDVGGWSGLMAITSVLGYYPDDDEPMVQIQLNLIEAWEGSLGDAPIEAVNNADYTDDRVAGLNPGWTNRINDKVRPDEDPPKASLWLVSNGINQAEALLYLYLSGNGDGTNDATYDKLACGFGFDGDPERLNIGVAYVPSPVTIDPGTSLLLELRELLNEKLEYRLRAGDKWGPWLVNESLRSMCLWVPEPSTGKVGWRQMDRPGPTSVSAINPLKSPKYKVEPGARLPAVESIRFEVGYQGKDLAPQDFRIIRLAETDSYRDSNKLPSEITIRHWKRGNFFANLNAGPIPRLSNFYFRQLKAAPSVFKVPASLLRGPLKVGDFVTWTDDSIQTASGRGVSDLTCMAIAQDSDVQSGPQWALLLPYALPVSRTATGKIAPALRIIHSEVVSATVFDVWCFSVGDTTVNLSTAYSGLFPAIVAASGRLRVVSPSRHNPISANERRGWLEASCTLTSVVSDGGIHRLRLSFDSDWTRAAVIDIRRDLLVHDQAYLVLSDRRPAGANVEGAEIVPPAAQRKGAVGNVIDIAHIAPPAPQQSFDGYYYLFS